MKLILSLFLLCLCFVPVCAEESTLTPAASGSILIDFDSGEVLYEKNMHEKLYPASMTKMMSLYLVLDAIEQNKLSWQQIITASENASKMGGSQIYLETGEKMSVQDLFKASTVASANDAIVALAEAVSGSVEEFVKQMNETALQFGCMNTHFVNPTGLHDDQHVSSAYDMAVIARQLILKGKDELLQYTSMIEDYIREDSDSRFWLVNTNKMLKSYSGMDGLKTGYTSDSMYCITVTAKRNGLRLIAVVMHEPDKSTRSKEASALLDYGFANYRHEIVLHANEICEQIQIDKGYPKTIELTNQDELGVTVKYGEEISVVNRTVVLKKMDAPIEKQEVVGTIEIELSNSDVLRCDLTAVDGCERLSFGALFLDCLMDTFF